MSKLSSKLPARNAPTEKSTKVECSICKARIKRSGLKKHMEAKHSQAPLNLARRGVFIAQRD